MRIVLGMWRPELLLFVHILLDILMLDRQCWTVIMQVGYANTTMCIPSTLRQLMGTVLPQRRVQQ